MRDKMNIQQLKNLILTKIDNRNDFNNLFTRKYVNINKKYQTIIL